MRTLFTNGRIRLDPEEPFSDWLLLEDDQLAGTGSAEDAPVADRVVDLGGAFLVEAFCDAHVHLPATGRYAAGMNFRGENSTDAILDAFARRSTSADPILFGGNFEDPLDRPLTRFDLDRVVGKRPALLARADMHSAIVSSALLDLLEVGHIEGVDRDDGGSPTGYLRERAASEAWKVFDAHLGRDGQVTAVNAAIDLAYSKGITEVHEMFVVEWRGWDSYEVFEETVSDRALSVLTYVADEDVDELLRRRVPRLGGDLFLDGAFGSHTAWMADPYLSEPPSGSSPTGISYRSDDVLFDLFLAACENKIQMGVHAIGDAAIDQAISTWEKVAEKVGIDVVRDLGHRIEHFECAWDDHIARAATLGLRASVQPAFDHFWGGEEGMYAQRIGPERALKMNRFATIASEMLLGAGSDSTVTPLDPLLQMHALTDHHVHEERMSRVAALNATTRHARALARPTGEVPGYADLALLDDDPLTSDDLLGIEVLGTWIKGRRVYPQAEAEER